jgi:hypothetical protein
MQRELAGEGRRPRISLSPIQKTLTPGEGARVSIHRMGSWGYGGRDAHPVALIIPQSSPRSVVGGDLWVLLMPNRPEANIVSDQRGAPAAAHLGAWQYAHRRAGIQVGPDLQPGVNPGTLSFFHERRDRSGSLGSCTLFGIDVRRGNPYDRGNNPYDRADRDRP